MAEMALPLRAKEAVKCTTADWKPNVLIGSPCSLMLGSYSESKIRGQWGTITCTTMSSAVSGIQSCTVDSRLDLPLRLPSTQAQVSAAVLSVFLHTAISINLMSADEDGLAMCGGRSLGGDPWLFQSFRTPYPYKVVLPLLLHLLLPCLPRPFIGELLVSR